MRRAVQSGASSAAPPASRLASSGNPSQGDPAGGTPATILGDRWFYEVQESIVRVIEEAGMTLAADPDQLKDAIMDLVGSEVTTNSDIDARIASWARDNSPSGTIPDNRVPSSIARDSEIASWARSSGASGTIPDNRIPSGIARDSEVPTVRTSIYTVGSNGEWRQSHLWYASPYRCPTSTAYEYITISLWAGTQASDQNVRTATAILRSVHHLRRLP